MLSLHNLSSAAQAESYYKTVNDYYVKDGEEQSEQGNELETDNGEHLRSAFIGSGSEQLGLTEFSKERFSELLRGKIDENTQIGRVDSTGELKHRPGWDATLSAPKSVSIMALVAGDERIIDAHHGAVEKTIAYFEKNAAFCRDKTGKWDKTNNLVVAAFTHSASRNLDPQLHTHNVILNATKNSEGKWRSLEPKAIYRQQKLAGAVYRSHLAHSLSADLGYQLQSKEDGLFEIKGVSDELIDKMSSRRKEIERIALEKGFVDAKGKEEAALMTRSSKRSASKASLQAAWKEMAKEHMAELTALIPEKRAQRGIQGGDKELDAQEQGAGTPGTPSQPQKEPGKQVPNRPQTEPEKLGPSSQLDDGQQKAEIEAALYDIRLSIKHLTTYEAVVSKQSIMEFALNNISGAYTPDHLERALDVVLAQKELLPSRAKSAQLSSENTYTTPTAWRRESLALDLLNQGKGLFKKPILSERAVNSHIRKLREDADLTGAPAINEGQADGLRKILSTKDQYLGIQGFAGTGKTFMWSEAKALAESARYKVRGFAPTGSAAEKLFEDSGISSKTIDSFLYANKNVLEGRGKITAKNELWVIDEAGLSNARHVVDMMMLARKAGARLVFQGDGAQLSAIEWGKLFKLLQENGMPTAKLDEIMRQKDHEVKAAVYNILDKDYTKAIANLGERVSEHKDDRVTPLVKDLMKLPKKDREAALVVIPDLETRSKATDMIRDALKSRGDIGAEEIGIKTLKDAKLSDPQKGDGRFYKKGMVVQFGKDMKSLGIKKGDRFTVSDDGQRNSVTLVGEKGNTLSWDPAIGGSSRFTVDVYRQEERGFSKGDRVRWTKSLKDMNLRNGQEGRVVSIDREKGTLQVEWIKRGTTEIMTIDSKKDRNIDHNYVHTAFISQGLDSKHVFTIAESWRRNLVNEKSFYVKLSRTKESINVYTDSKDRLTKAISRKAEKTSAIESQRGQRSKAKAQSPRLSWVDKLIRSAKERLSSRDHGSKTHEQREKRNATQRQTESTRGGRGIER